MKLNLHIIEQDLIAHVTDVHLTSAVESRLCSTVRPYLGSGTLLEGFAYVATAAELPESPLYMGHPSLICIGTPPRGYFTDDIDLLVLDSSCTTGMVLDRLAVIFRHYDEWESSLQNLVNENAPVQELGRASQPLFVNPLYCQGAEFKCLFLYGGDLTNASEEMLSWYLTIFSGKRSIAPGSYLPINAVTRLLADPYYIESNSKQGLAMYDNPTQPGRVLYYNIGPENAHIARLCVFEVYRRTTRREEALLCVLATYVERKLRRENTNAPMEPQALTPVTNGLLIHKLLPQERIQRALADLSWRVDDTYFCMVLESMAGDASWQSLQALAAALDIPLSEEFHVVFRKQLVYIFNLTHLGCDDEDVLHAVVPIFRDAILRGGSSNCFADYKNLYYYYLQARDALICGSRENPSFWYYRYRDYSLDILLDRCRDKRPVEAFFPRELQELRSYDAQHGTSLVPLLHRYLLCDRSATATARELFISRSTCIRHLQQIERISNIKLDNPKTRLELVIAFALMAQEERRSHDIRSAGIGELAQDVQNVLPFSTPERGKA